jgi:uncharacterized protein
LNNATEFRAGSVEGFLHQPAGGAADGIVLTHGAGGNCRSQLLVTVAEALSRDGFLVLRFDLPFRQQRPFGPPAPANAARDREALKAAATGMRSMVRGRVLLGGHSYGGRQASMLAAQDPGSADALLLLSYPLHPPKKPNQMRTDHFPHLQTPALFVQGTKDPFATEREMREALRTIPVQSELLMISSAGHDLLKGAFNLSQVSEALRRLRSTPVRQAIASTLAEAAGNSKTRP